MALPATAAEERDSTVAWSTGSRRRFLRRLSPFTVVGAVVATAMVFLAVYPIARLAVHLFWADGEFNVGPFREAFTLPGIGTLVWQTVAVVGASSVVALLIGSVLAWLNERTNARIGALTDTMPMVPFLLPPIAGAIGWVFLLAPSAGFINAVLRSILGWFGLHLTTGPFDIYSWYGIIAVYVVYQVPYVFLLVSAGLRNVDASLEEQSRICGRSAAGTMYRVTLPAIRPSLAASLVLLFWNGFGLFSVPAIIGPGAHIQILSVRIVRLLSFSYPPQLQTALGLSVILLCFVGSAWYVQSRISRLGRHATVGGKTIASRRVSLGAWRWPVRAVMLGYLVIGTVLPVLALALVSLNGYWTPHIRWSELSLTALRDSLSGNSTTALALTDSLVLGAVGATVGIVCAAVLSLFLLRRTSRLARVVDGVIKMPAAISHIVIGVGFLLAFAGGPFGLHGTLTLLLLAYIVLWMPQGLVTTDAAVGGVGTELAEASAVCGAGGARTFGRIYLPLMLGGLAAGWAFLFVRMVGDLTASSLLAGSTNPVIGFRILDIFEAGSFAELASLSLVLVAITGFVVVLVLGFARRRIRTGVTGAS